MRDFETRHIAIEVGSMLEELYSAARDQAAAFISEKGHHLRLRKMIDLGGRYRGQVIQVDLVGYNEFRSPPSMIDRLQKDLDALRSRANELEAQRMATDGRERQRSLERKAMLRLASKS